MFQKSQISKNGLLILNIKIFIVMGICKKMKLGNARRPKILTNILQKELFVLSSI